MVNKRLVENFIQAVRRSGAEVTECGSPAATISYVCARAGGDILLPPLASGERLGLRQRLLEAGCGLSTDEYRQRAPYAAAGLTGSNFALADTGTVVLASTDEPVRLATSLPERHFILLDPRKIVADGLAAIPFLRRLQQPGSFISYITGPSRTADIERVLTIGVHGPREVHILLLEGLSDDFMEM